MFHDVKGLEEKKGFLEIPGEVVEEFPNLMMWVMGHVIVVRAEYVFMKRSFEYQAYSPLFEDTPAHMIPPTYRVEWNTNHGPRFIKDEWSLV